MTNELKRAFTSPLLYITMIMFFLCMQGFALPVSIFEGIYELLENRQSALALSIGSIFFGGVILLIPFFAPMGHAISQVDDIRSSMLQWSVLRGSVKTYAFHKILASFLASAVCLGAAFAVHALIWNIIVLPYDPALYPVHEICFSGDMYTIWATQYHAWPIYVYTFFGIAFTAGVWSVVALAVSVWIPDKLLVVIVPACIYKLWSGNITYRLFGFSLIEPDTLFNDLRTVSNALWALLAYAIVLALSIVIYLAGLKRRACNA